MYSENPSGNLGGICGQFRVRYVEDEIERIQNNKKDHINQDPQSKHYFPRVRKITTKIPEKTKKMKLVKLMKLHRRTFKNSHFKKH